MKRPLRPLVQIALVFTLLTAAGSVATGLIVRYGLQSAISGSCKRLNIKQQEDNGAQFGNYLSDREFLTLIAGMSSREQTPRQIRETAEFVKPERFAEQMQAWVPLLRDCRHVDAGFVLPKAVAFYQRLPDASELPPAARTALTELLKPRSHPAAGS